MPLPSQTARPASTLGRANMQRAGKPMTRAILLGGGAVLVLALGVWALTGRHDDKQVGSPQSASGTVQPAEPPKTTPDKVLAVNDRRTETPPPAVVNPPPVEVRQGRAPEPQGISNQAPSTGNGPALGHTAGATPVEAPKPTVEAPPPAAALGGSAPAEVQSTLATAQQRKSAGDVVAARALMSRALADERITESDKQTLRTELTKINEDLVFSTRIAKDDPFVEAYAVQGGDNLIRIAKTLHLAPDYRLIARVNKMANAHSLREGQKLKIVKGPFHAVVNKSAYRLDLYMGPAENPDQWVYVRSFKVGLGEKNGTPVGQFIVKKGSKLIDPPWTHPNTGEHFNGGDPKNPIGHRWVGLEGVGESAQYKGYGLHGTIDPDSIGQQRSMGCVRMATEDIELVFELMGEQVSVVKIVP